MLVKNELLSKIKDYFDLNQYESKIWLALLSKGIASAGEVAEMSGVPRSRAYDVLESLEKRGFAIIKIGKPVKYLGVKPKIILEKLKNNIKADAEDRMTTLAKITSTDEFSQLENLYNQGIEPVRREDISASLKGKSNISNYLREILQNAEKEVVICTNADEFMQKIKLFEQTITILQKNGIKIKIALSGDNKIIEDLRKRLKLKIFAIKIDTKFFIVDGKEILFYVSKQTDEEDIAVWLNSEFFSQAFLKLFEKAIGEN